MAEFGKNRSRTRRAFGAGWLMISALLSTPISTSFAGNLPEEPGVFARQGALAASGVRQVAGPLPLVDAWQAESQPAELTADAGFDFAPCGSLSFWFRNEEPYESGPGAPRSSESLLEAPGVVDIRIQRSAETYGLVIRHLGAGDNLRLLIPSMPASTWNHLAVEWDHERGIFDAWLNGSPAKLPGTAIAPWAVSLPQTHLTLRIDATALSDVRLSAGAVEPAGLKEELTSRYFKSSARLLGDYEPEPVDLSLRRGELLYEWSLESPEQVADWVMEGPGEVRFEDGWMQMESRFPEGPDGHFVFWPRPDLPENFLAEWDFQLLDPDGPGLAIVFFAARGQNREDLFDPALAPRNGVFARYHSGDINCYHISYYANNPFRPGRITSNLRKNSGFYLAANGPAGIRPGSGQIYRIALLKDGKHLRFTVNGREIINYTDDGQRLGPVHGGGKIGLRQMEILRAQYRNLRIYTVRAISFGRDAEADRAQQ